MPCGKESSPRIAIGRKLLTEEPSCEAGDMTAPTIGNAGKLTLDQRASSRHGGFGADSGPSRGAYGRGVFRPFETIAIPAATGCRRL
jgi:hypothetical protein